MFYHNNWHSMIYFILLNNVMMRMKISTVIFEVASFFFWKMLALLRLSSSTDAFNTIGTVVTNLVLMIFFTCIFIFTESSLIMFAHQLAWVCHLYFFLFLFSWLIYIWWFFLIISCFMIFFGFVFILCWDFFSQDQLGVFKLSGYL